MIDYISTPKRSWGARVRLGLLCGGIVWAGVQVFGMAARATIRARYATSADGSTADPVATYLAKYPPDRRSIDEHLAEIRSTALLVSDTTVAVRMQLYQQYLARRIEDPLYLEYLRARAEDPLYNQFLREWSDSLAFEHWKKTPVPQKQ